MTTATVEDANKALRSAVRERLEAAAKAESCCEGRRFYGHTGDGSSVRAAHPSSQAFYDLCDSLKDMHQSKSRDYGSSHDPLANIRNGAEFVGIPAWKAAMVRLSDKVTRLATYNRTGTLTNESVEDSLLDLASYSLLALVLHREGRE